MTRLAFVFLLFAVPAFGQATPEPPLAKPVVTLPASISGEVGEWIVIVPDKVYGGEVKWRIGAGLQPVDLGRLFPGIKPAGIVVKAKADGRYEIWAWNAKADIASDLAVAVVVIGKPVVQPPDDPKPDPTPTGALYFMLVRQDGPALPEFTRVVSDPAWDALRTAGHRVKDFSLTDARKLGAVVPAGTPLPCVVPLRTVAGKQRQVEADGKTLILEFPTNAADIGRLPEGVR